MKEKSNEMWFCVHKKLNSEQQQQQKQSKTAEKKEKIINAHSHMRFQ